MALIFILGFITGVCTLITISTIFWMVRSKKSKIEYAEKILEENK